MHNDEQKIRINAIDLNGSVADGYGVRAVVFFQGCDRHCPGCHNAVTWDVNGGREMSVREIVSELLSSPFRRVTISGGEPLLQMDGLIALLSELGRNGFEVALYTGRDDIDVPTEVFPLIDYLKTGSFVQELKTSTKPFVGSSNQVFRKVA